MTEKTEELISEALKLAPDQRALIAAELAASLHEDEPSSPEQDRAWLTEVERRVRQAHRGETEKAGWSEVEARIRERLRNRHS